MKMALIGIVSAILISNNLSVNKNAHEYENTGQRTRNESTRSAEIPTPIKEDRVLHGKASYYTNDYCKKFNPNCITASGEVFDDTSLTTACPSYIKLGSRLRVTHGENSVIVRCTDRGSFQKKYGRILDLSKSAFESLAPLSRGVINITVEII